LNLYSSFQKIKVKKKEEKEKKKEREVWTKKRSRTEVLRVYRWAWSGCVAWRGCVVHNMM